MNVIDRRAASVICTVLIFGALIGLIYQARRPLIALIFAILFAYLLEPLVSRFESWLHSSRGVAIAATYASLGLVSAAFLIGIGPRILEEGERLIKELPGLMENVGSGHIAEQIGGSRGWDYETQVRVGRFLRDHRDDLASYSLNAGNWAAELAGNLLWLLLIPILAVFVLKSKSEFASAFIGLIDGTKARRFFRAVLTDLDLMLAAFIRAQLSLAALALIAYTLFLLLGRFPYAFAVGAIGGMLEFIPVVGAFATAVLILGIAVLTGYGYWLPLLIFLIVWRGIQDYVNSPYLMGRGLLLHPAAVIFGVLVGGEIAGVVGVFLSVPVMAGLRIVWKNWRIQKPESDIEILDHDNVLSRSDTRF